MRLGTWQRWAVLGLLALVASFAALPAAWAQKGKGGKAKGRDIAGAVVDPSGAPVTGATITVQGLATPMTAQSGADGTFTLAQVPLTNLTLTVDASGYVPQQVEVIGGKTALQLQVVMAKVPPPPPPETRVISGVVLDGKRAPVVGATVTVDGTSTQTVTEEDGTFTLIGVTTADVTLDVVSTGLPPQSIPVPAAKGAVIVTLGSAGGGVVTPPPPQTRSLSGTVIETDTKTPIIGATVIVTGTDFSAITDENGKYTIDGLPMQSVSVQITADQHETKVSQVDPGTTTLDASLALTQSEQIVIEGRAPVILKQNLANGASTVSDKDLNRVSAPTLDSALQGKVAGANMQFNSGAPGGGAQLRLRGISTINGQSSPLYVIDGVIVSNVSVPSGANAITAAAAGGSASNQDNPVNRIADLNPNDIENVEILKGASAAALYGSKAANGVVIITTKRGHGGGTQVSVTQRFGTSMLSHEMPTREYHSLADVQAAFCPPDDPATPANENDCSNGMTTAYMAGNGKTYDYQKELTQSKLAEETIASAAGGTEASNYYGSVLVHQEPGTVIGTYYDKQSGRLSLGYSLWDRVKLGISANIIHSRSDRGLTNNDNTGTSMYVVLSSLPSFIDLHPTDGVYPSNPTVGSGANPLQTVQLFKNVEDVWRLIAGTNAQVDAYHGGPNKVTLLGNLGVDSFTQKNNLLSPPILTFEAADGLLGTSINATTTNLNFNLGTAALWEYKPKGAKYHSALSAGLTYESVDLDSVYDIAQNLISGQPNVDSSTAVTITETRLRTKDSGLYAQEEVGLLDDKVTLLGAVLGERSSLNGDTGHYYLFPKFAGTYDLPVAKNIFDTLRARAAFGEAGNRPNYGQKFTPLTTSNIEGHGGVNVGGISGDPNIKPERQQELELGVDAATKNDRAVVEFTFYNRTISDLLLQRALAQSTGFTTQFANGGSMRNRGIELAVTVNPVNGTFDWTSRASLTLNRSKILSLPGSYFDITAAGFGTGLGAFRIEEGHSATQIVTEEADPAKCTGKGQDPCEKIVGDGEPSFRVGWSNELKYKAFTLDALLDWQQGSKVINLTRLLYDASGNSPDVAAANARLTAFSGGDPTPYIEDASFLKIREVSLTYDFPQKIAEQIGPVKTLQLQLSGRNLATFTNYSGLDPEVSNFGNQPIGRNYDVAPYPPSRSYWLSLTAGL